jgi:hypothetical protein
VPDNNGVREKEIPLITGIDVKIRIPFIEIMDGYMVFTVQCGQERPVGP